MNDYLDVLAHHGIKGQKWDIRNGPPYPLNPEDYSAAEKRLNKISSKKQKLEKKSEKLHRQSAKKELKAAKKKLKADRMKSRRLWTGQDRVYQLEHKAAILGKKAAKKEIKSIRLEKRAKALGKEYIQLKAQMKVSDISKTRD